MCISANYFPQVFGGSSGDTGFTSNSIDSVSNLLVGGYTYDVGISPNPGPILLYYSPGLATLQEVYGFQLDPPQDYISMIKGLSFQYLIIAFARFDQMDPVVISFLHKPSAVVYKSYSLDNIIDNTPIMSEDVSI